MGAKQRHALVIGGTGMLAEVSQWLADTGITVSVIGRTSEKHRKLIELAANPQFIDSLVFDYNDLPSLQRNVKKAITKNGPISLVVSWTHTSEPLEVVKTVLSEQKEQWKLVQIKGSRRYFEKDNSLLPANCKHRTIYLGFIVENNQSRWLTNQEISEGVIKSIKEDTIETIIGTLQPYDKRPLT
jgi:hypothetical protein